MRYVVLLLLVLVPGCDVLAPVSVEANKEAARAVVGVSIWLSSQEESK